jgi:hypothetical protein
MRRLVLLTLVLGTRVGKLYSADHLGTFFKCFLQLGWLTQLKLNVPQMRVMVGSSQVRASELSRPRSPESSSAAEAQLAERLCDWLKNIRDSGYVVVSVIGLRTFATAGMLLSL